MQGIGPSILLPNALAILGHTYPPGRRKNMVFAAFGGCAPGGAVIGSVFSALFAEYASWSWSFYMFAIGLVFIAVVGVFAIPTIPRSPTHFTVKTLIAELDLLAAAVGITGLILVNIAWNQAPTAGWGAPYVIVLLVLGLILAALFFYIELHHASHPLLPMSVINSQVAFVLACVALGWGSFGIWSYYLWQFMLQIRGLSPLLATAWWSPVAAVGAAAAVCTGKFLGRMGPAWAMVCAMSAFLTGSALLAFMPGLEGQLYWKQAFVCLLIMPWGSKYTSVSRPLHCFITDC
jgi:MFS family permease